MAQVTTVTQVTAWCIMYYTINVQVTHWPTMTKYTFTVAYGEAQTL